LPLQKTLPVRMNSIFTAVVYVDYRKEVEIEILKSFMKKEAAIDFANKELQSSEQEYKEKYPGHFQEEEDSEVGEYVQLHGNENLPGFLWSHSCYC